MHPESKIHILPEHVMKRIAAGEVVERPASVVKELLENALDARAGSISLFIRAGGLESIQVTDDGDGMTEADARLCCERHATSKIASAEDLEAIRTFGFRGEALSSIGSVSRMIITTRTGDAGEAVQIFIEDGKAVDVRNAPGLKGTSIEVKDLFASVPARRKFLKTPATELRHMLSVFRRTALSHPETAFTLHLDGTKTLDLKSGPLGERVRDLWGETKASALIWLQAEFGSVSVHGAVSRPDETVPSRDDQLFFLNRRNIVHKGLWHALVSAYSPRLAKDQFPLSILFLEMDPARFDVNVHPTKIEVRFSDDRFVYDCVKKAVQDALRKPAAVPDLRLVLGKKKEESATRPLRGNQADESQLTLDMQRPMDEGTVFHGRRPDSNAPDLWQLHRKYILSQIKSGLTIIDQHVAHERILYEKALRAIETQAGSAQQLLFPQTVTLSHEDFLVLTEILPYLEKVGFFLKDFGGNTVVIEAVPVDIRPGREKEIFFGLLEEFKQSRQGTLNVADAVAKSYACRSAIKAGDRLNLSEMVSLIDQLFATSDPYVCPHGRPVVVNLSLEEIDKRFGR
jgi:DNA mismatch repair protein MutL